jgi:hypothetical protein
VLTLCNSHCEPEWWLPALALVERAIPAQPDHLEDEAGWLALNIIVKKPRPDRAEIYLKQIQSD